VLQVVAAAQPDHPFRGCRIELVSGDKRLRAGEQVLDWAGECLGATGRQYAVRGPHEQLVGERPPQLRQHARHGRLCARKPSGSARNAALIEQSVEHDQQVQVYVSDIRH
jgi:hypothetical protein